MSELTDLLRDLEYDPDMYFYLRLNASHVWGMEPFFKVGEVVLLTLWKHENICKPGDMCVVMNGKTDSVRIFSESEDPAYLVFTAANSKIPPLVLAANSCKYFRIIKHENE